MTRSEKVTDDTKDAAWFQRFLDSVDDLILVKGDRSRLQWANKAFRDLYGMTQAQLQDIVDSPASDPDDTVQYVRDDHHVFTTGEAVGVPAEAVTDHLGQVHYYNTVKSAVRDADGKIVGTVGISRLVEDPEIRSKSREDRAARKGTLEELNALVENIPLGVAMFDRRNRLYAASKMWHELFDLTEAAQGAFYDMTFEVQLPLAKAMENVVVSGEAFDCEGVEMVRGERPSVVSVMVRPWELGAGDVGGVVVHVEDRTEQLGTAARLGRVNAELAEFNYRISHDLVAPLATTEGLIAMAQQQLAGGKIEVASACIDRVATENKRLQALIANVLELGRAELDEEIQTEILSLHRVCEEVFEATRSAADEAGVTLSYSSEVDGVLTSDQRLFRVLVNLVQNSIKYRSAGEQRWVRVEANTVADRFFERLEIRVADNGVGVPESVAPKVFDLFVRGSASHEGSGLGLYIAKTHAERLGGRLTLESAHGPTVFLLTLPLVAPKETAGTGEASA